MVMVCSNGKVKEGFGLVVWRRIRGKRVYWENINREHRRFQASSDDALQCLDPPDQVSPPKYYDNKTL